MKLFGLNLVLQAQPNKIELRRKSKLVVSHLSNLSKAKDFHDFFFRPD